MITKYASAVILSAEMAPEAPRHPHDHTPFLAAQQRTFRHAHRHAFDYDKRPGYLYVRSRAISSRCNDNYDEFPAEEIKKGYLSFIGKPVFVNHKNDNHRRARGVVIAAALHEDTNPDGTPDTWVEVLMEVDAKQFPKLAKAILAGEIDRTSMGTDVAFSVCSFCGNKASTPLEYCQHIPKLKGKRIRRRTANGNQEDVLVREICYGLRFFENSLLVEEPADPTAFFLGVEGDDVTATAGIVTEANKTASTWKVNWDWAKYQPRGGNDFTNKYPQGFEIEAEDLEAAKEKIKTEYKFNPFYLKIEKTGVRREARICGEYAPENYFPNECPSWQPYYYASWIKPEGTILAVTQHDDAPGKQAGAFGNGWVRLMVTDYPSNPYLQVEAQRWPLSSGQKTALTKLARELECKRSCVIQVAEASAGNGLYNVPPATLNSFLNQEVPVGGGGQGSVRDFYDRFSSKQAKPSSRKRCPGVGREVSKQTGLTHCPVCRMQVYVDQGVILGHSGTRNLGRDTRRPSTWLGAKEALNDDFSKLAAPWSEEDEKKHPRGQPGNSGQFAPKGTTPAPKKSRPPKEARPPGAPKGDMPLRHQKDPEQEYEPPFLPNPKKKYKDRKAEDYQPKKLPPEERAKHPIGSQENPRVTDDHNEVIEALWRGEWVELKRPEEVTLVAERLGNLKDWIKAQNAKDKEEWVAQGGDPALYEDKGFNLCKITVPGTNLFCTETKDIPRIKMPQLKANNPLPGSRAEKMERDSRGEVDLNPLFKRMLQRVGIKVTDKDRDGNPLTRRTTKLKATQNELQGEKIGFFTKLIADKGMEAIEGGIFVSRDGYIVDGHHRWAGIMAADLLDGHAGDLEMQVEIIDADIIDILRMANDFCAYYGLPSQDAKTWAGYDPDAKKAASLNADFARLSKVAGRWTQGDYDKSRWVFNDHPFMGKVQGNDSRRPTSYTYTLARDLGGMEWETIVSGTTDSVTTAKRTVEQALTQAKRTAKLAYGETKAPAQVDTLRDANCPVCGEESAYDGEKCLVCGFIKPPDSFMDPDLEKAQQMDLRQKEDENMPGGTTLVCDECGAKFQSQGGGEKPSNPFAEKEEEEADEEAGSDEEESDEKAKKKSAPPWADKKKSSAQMKHLAERGEMDELFSVYRQQAEHLKDQGINNKGQPPIRPCRHCGSPAVFDRIYMSFPSTYAKYDCPSCKKETGYAPLKAGEEPPADEPRVAAKVAVDRFPEDKPPQLAMPKMEKPKDPHSGEAPDATEPEDVETTPQAGDTCPECGKGTLRPVGHEHMDDNPEKLKKDPPGEEDEEDEDKPPWQKGDKSKEKDQKTSRRIGVEMRPALAALAEQQKVIDQQARQIKALKQAVKGIARLAGVDEHPKFAALMKIADEDNPSQPIPDPPAEAPAQTTDEALGDLNDEDVEQVGATGLTDVSADATTDVLSTEVVLDEPLDLNEQDPTKPVAGTEEPRPLSEVKTETEVRIGDPNNPDTMFPMEGDFAQRATTGAKEARTLASLRLARLRVQAGIASGDDIALATAIASSGTSDEVIQAEIETLSKVVRTAGRQQAPRNLVPRMAQNGQGHRQAPSLSEPPFQAPEMQVVASVDPDEILFE